MGRKKKPDIDQQQRELRHRLWEMAKPLHVAYPDVKELTIHLAFVDSDTPEPRDQTFSSESRAHFVYECPFRECIVGGFDLAPAVSQAIKERAEETFGRLVCDGWQDRERINKHRCLLECNYRIHVTYGRNNA